MTWTPAIDNWIVATGVMAALACALPGNFLVLRRMSMMGDAITHAVLPGLAVAFLMTSSRGSVTMFVGAVLAGLLTTLFTQWVERFGRVDGNAAMGVVFTTLFAVGLILIVRSADHVDLDPSCVLYGSIEQAVLDTVRPFGIAMPRAFLTLLIVFAINAILFGVFYKEFKLSAFDPALATTLGINATVMHYLLMIVVAVTTVAAFEAVGSILVIAMLIVPPATARLLTDRLGVMILLSLVLGAASAGLGHVGAITVPSMIFPEVSDTTTAGVIAVVAGLLFVMALLLSPRHGVISRAVHRWQLNFHIVKQDVLGLVYRLEEHPGEHEQAVQRILQDAMDVRPMVSHWAIGRLVREGLLNRMGGDDVRLTETGREHATRLVRAHRLWETYLERHLDLPAGRLHPTAERFEHVTTETMAKRLADSTDRPAQDPHGRDIPR